jgi:MFS family permease
VTPESGPIAAVPIAKPSGLAAALYAMAPALRTRNFRLFWLGQLISVAGTSVQVVAEGWLVYNLTGSTFWLGMVGLLGLLPAVPISFAGGVLIDRVPRRKLILITQCGLLLQALIFALLALSGEIHLWQIICLYFVFGSLLAIDHPARRAFLVQLVEHKDLASAVALNATVFNMSSLIGYALAGLMLATLGVGYTMLFNAATYLAPIAALLLIRVVDVGADPVKQGEAKKPFTQALLEGFTTLWRQPAILGVLALMAVVGGMAYPLFGLMPAFAKEVFDSGEIGLGLLLASGALGSVIGTAVTARAGSRLRGRTLFWVSCLLPWVVVLFAMSRTLWLACLLMVFAGIALLVLQSLAITLVQIYTPDRVRGRVMSIYSQLHAGSDTMGNVVTGTLALYTGLPLALMAGSALALIFALGLRAVLPAITEVD